MNLLRRGSCVALLAIACGGDDGGDSATVADASSGGTATSTMTTAGSESTGGGSSSDTASTTAPTTSAMTVDTDDGSTSKTTDDTAATTDSGGTGVTACGDAVCGADEICINPCCGGPAPGCEDANPDGACASGQEPVPADQCPGGCSTTVCCPMAPCIPDPPSCVGKDTVKCHETQCSAGSCFGMLVDDQLMCECA